MRARLLLGTVLLTVATIAAFFIPAAAALTNAERRAQVVELQRDATDATAHLRPGSTRTFEPRPEGDDEDGDGDWRTDEHRYAVYDASGRKVDGTGPAQADGPVLEAIAGRSATGRVGDERVASVPLADGGAVRAAEPASEADDRARAAFLRLSAIAIAILVAGCAAAWLLARRLTDPLRRLGLSANRLGGGDFTATAPTAGIAEIDAVAVALNASATRIGQMVERERRLTADTSHQLRTPITGLRLAIEAELAAPRPDATEVLREALGAVDRLEATVTALNDLARDTAPTDPFDLAALVDAAVARWRPLVEAAGRALDAGPVAGTSTARRAAVDTIVDVLLDNALAHGTGTVRLDVDLASGAALLAVRDDGSCSGDPERVFERHRSGSGSTGIGLHLARSLAEAEGARLRLARRDPTTFELLLPLAARPDPR